MEYGFHIDKRFKVFHRDDLQIIDLFLQMLQFSTKMRGAISEDLFDHSPAFILCDEILEGPVV